MYLEIITPDKKIFEGTIRLIQLPGSLGSFEILRNHAPIISTLDEGTIKVIDENNREVFFGISGGVIETTENKIIVLAEAG
ncbi:MAG: ATP synthase F1 subunit epsilon [Bacteroidetes bacterium]|nr:ATP synthase F1 subunit epsilon [Bacteroidota bacterium]